MMWVSIQTSVEKESSVERQRLDRWQQVGVTPLEAENPTAPQRSRTLDLAGTTEHCYHFPIAVDVLDLIICVVSLLNQATSADRQFVSFVGGRLCW